MKRQKTRAVKVRSAADGEGRKTAPSRNGSARLDLLLGGGDLFAVLLREVSMRKRANTTPKFYLSHTVPLLIICGKR